jgi:hypothetical protein
MITVVLIVLTTVDVALLAVVYLILRRGVHFHSIGMRVIAILSIAVFLFGFAFSFTSWNIAFSMLMSVALACYMFLSCCLGAWLSDRQLAWWDRKMAERSEFREAVRKSFILRNVVRFGEWQRAKTGGTAPRPEGPRRG